jgi:hypothetical protein
LRCDAKVLFNALRCFLESPILTTHEHIHAIACTAGLIFTTAVIAEPGAGAIKIVKAVAIFAAT